MYFEVSLFRLCYTNTKSDRVVKTANWVNLKKQQTNKTSLCIVCIYTYSSDHVLNNISDYPTDELS